jgi:hypothetical protein
MKALTLTLLLPGVVAMYLPFCASEIRPELRPAEAPRAVLWEDPTDLEERDLHFGPWGQERAPDPAAKYALVEHKHNGVNPGMTVRDPAGRLWSVKQAPLDECPDEGPIEVVLSRVLSAAGYYQPAVYHLPRFTLSTTGVRISRTVAASA